MSDTTETPIGEPSVAEGSVEPAAAPFTRKRGWSDHTITIRSPEKLREAWIFAQNNGMQEQFSLAFTRMLAIVAGHTAEADLREWDLRGYVGYDGSNHSFNWGAEIVGPIPPVPMRETVQGLHGGLIYHGRGSGETFSMTMTSGEEQPWQIHT